MHGVQSRLDLISSHKKRLPICCTSQGLWLLFVVCSGCTGVVGALGHLSPLPADLYRTAFQTYRCLDFHGIVSFGVLSTGGVSRCYKSAFV